MTSAATACVTVSQKELLDLLPLGVCIIDRDLKVRAWNAALVNWTGITQESAIGINLVDRYPRLSAWCFRDRLNQVFSTGTPAIFSAAFHKYFIPVPPRQGGPNTDMIQQATVRPLDEDLEHALVAIQDVTAQYLQMEELRKERTRLEKVVA